MIRSRTWLGGVRTVEKRRIGSSFIIASVCCPAAVRVSHLFLADLSRGWKNTAVTPPSDIQFPSMSSCPRTSRSCCASHHRCSTPSLACRGYVHTCKPHEVRLKLRDGKHCKDIACNHHTPTT